MVFLLLLTTVFAATQIFQVADDENLDDTYIETNNSISDRGTAINLRLVATATDERDMVFKFNISSIPDGVTILNAVLRLFLNAENIDTNESYSGNTHHIFAFPTFSISDSEWTEGNDDSPTGCIGNELCWNERPISGEFNETAESSVTFTGPDVDLGWYNWSVTNMVKSDYEGGNENVSIWIRTTLLSGEPTIADFVRFSSKENSNSTQHPMLEVTYVSCGISLNTTSINFGSVSLGEESSEQGILVNNTGIDSGDIFVSGTDWDSTLLASRTGFSNSSGDFSSKKLLSPNPQLILDDLLPNNPTNTYWQFKAEPNDPSGNYSQTITFTFECDEV
jgi:hypothetical protein